MHPTGRHRLALLAAVLATASALAARPASLGARATPCEFEKVERIVAVGDVHGAYQQFLEILRASEVIDAQNRWIGGRTHLVQTGDVLDRGPDSRQALEFLRRLTRDAERAGGRVHALLGNHEAMRLVGDFRYVTPGEYAAFANSDSVATRKAVIETLPAADRARAEQETPLGMIEMIRAFGPDQDFGAYLRTLNAVVRINGILFLHGGISPAVASMTCADINDTVRRELGRDIDKTKATTQREPRDEGGRPTLVPRPRERAGYVRAGGEEDSRGTARARDCARPHGRAGPYPGPVRQDGVPHRHRHAARVPRQRQGVGAGDSR